MFGKISNYEEHHDTFNLIMDVIILAMNIIIIKSSYADIMDVIITVMKVLV